DYSFIPEMCPSGNVVAFSDSDEYLVVEMQPREHESRNLRPGPIEVSEVAEGLLEWTTAEHRANIARSILYHAAERPAKLAEFITQSGAFVDAVSRRLVRSQPHPHRNHHYWIGSVAVNRALTKRPLGQADWTFLLGEKVPKGGWAGALWWLRAKLLGFP